MRPFSSFRGMDNRRIRRKSSSQLGLASFLLPKVPRSSIGALNMIESDIKTHDADDVDSNIWPVVQAIGFVTAIILWGIAAFALAGMF